ncbi:ATP-binding cassette domain-containing protein [Desulfovibrio mangrovi]|uniref:ATP-binding cassette domain-containing protein n=1 Tax=Desulfovibrio mangrovi TaxID=2976983 RepID=UPI0022485063|nr:ATP-binding cassette domain-containing protein [Desulfovibrio mangrovi]UZP68839.1 ATP-binding cassette domain-containing protein [Desulfovibrio mangrovi]
MGELFRRMARQPVAAFELVLATFFVTLLNLASPIFVIQVLNRYVAFGFDGTLITLTSGMGVAIVLLYAFNAIRTRLAVVVTGDEDDRLATAGHEAMLRIRAQVMGPEVARVAQEIPLRAATIRAASEPSAVLQMLDAPFALLYLFAAFLLSPPLALIGLTGMLLTAALNRWSNDHQALLARDVDREEAEKRLLTASVLAGSDAVRVFRGAGFVRRIWGEKNAVLDTLRFALTLSREKGRSASSVIAMLQSVGVYSIGAMQVVNGDITVGVLIGVNILTARALSAGSGLASSLSLSARARSARQDILRFISLPQEARSGTALQNFSGKLEIRDAAFGWPGSRSPLFESLSMTLEPGMLTVVQGPNGAGKTTFARMLAGLVDPARGDIVADGVTLSQIAPEWWRKQISYLPQEAVLFPATLRENICLGLEEPDEASLNRAINEADLSSFLFSRQEGIELMLEDAGRSLSAGIRKRMALARALMTNGRVVILDEPTEALDKPGRQAVFRCVVRMLREGRTIIVISADPGFERLAGQKLDLGSKPVPQVVRRTRQEAGTPIEQVSGIGSAASGVSQSAPSVVVQAPSPAGVSQGGDNGGAASATGAPKDVSATPAPGFEKETDE